MVGGFPLVVYYWADLQSVHGFRCCDNIHICKLTAICSANVYSAEGEMSVSACTRSMAGSYVASATSVRQKMKKIASTFPVHRTTDRQSDSSRRRLAFNSFFSSSGRCSGLTELPSPTRLTADLAAILVKLRKV